MPLIATRAARIWEATQRALYAGPAHEGVQAEACVVGDPEDLHAPPGLNALQVKARDDPVIDEPESEPGVVVEWNHPAFFLNRISTSFSRLVIALIAASRFKAELRP